MQTTQPWLLSQRIVQICLFLFTGICLFGGTLQMIMGEPDTTQRLDNIHRFLAGIYLGSGFFCALCAWTVREQGPLVYLIALAAFLGGMGRVVSMNVVGTPEPAGLWYGYLAAETVVPVIIVLAHWATRNRS